MRRSKTLFRGGQAILPVLLLFLAFPSRAAQPYHLELEANPAAPFPFLGRLGTIDLHVYPGGVRAETMLLNGFSRNGQDRITVLNPLARTYSEVPLREFQSIVRKLAAPAMKGVDGATPPPIVGPIHGTVHGIEADRYRIQYAPAAWIDLWTTKALPDNPQLRAIVDQLVIGIAPQTAVSARRVPGVPLYVELNFSRFRKLPILKVKKLTMSAEGEEDALKTGPFYLNATPFDWSR